jgi:hypothetical protein
MWQIIRYFLIFCVLIVVAGVAFGAPTYMKGEGNTSVKMDESSYGMITFQCNAKLYYSDIPLPKFQGCGSEDISFGPGGLDAKLITVFYDWQNLPEDMPKQAKSAMFLEKPDGEMYRLKNTDFLTNIRLQKYFEDATGRGRGVLGAHNLYLNDFSVRNIQSYGNTFCVTHYLKFPFVGAMGWCQGDYLVGGEVGYHKGALSFSRAAILAQSHAFDQNLRLAQDKLFHEETKAALKIDKHGYRYWAFAAPAQKIGQLGAYLFKVYFNGTVMVNEYPQLPTMQEM